MPNIINNVFVLFKKKESFKYHFKKYLKTFFKILSKENRIKIMKNIYYFFLIIITKKIKKKEVNFSIHFKLLT